MRRFLLPRQALRSPPPQPADEFRASSFRGFFGLARRLTIDHLAHHRAFRSQLSVHRRFAFQLAEVAAPVEDLDFDAQLIAGHHGTPESRPIDGHKIEQLILAIRNIQQQQKTARLRHRLKNQDPRHDRLPGKMSLKVVLVDRDILDTDAALEAFHLENRVHHQKWIAMRQQFLNFHDVQYHSRSPSPQPPSAASGPTPANFQLYANPRPPRYALLRSSRSLQTAGVLSRR